MFGSKCWFLVIWKLMHARVISEMGARKGLFGHWYAQAERPFWRMHTTNFWAARPTDARKVWGKSRMPATHIQDADNPSNQPWELCDDIFTKWNKANEITLPAKELETLRVVTTTHLFLVSVWAYYGSSVCGISSHFYTQNTPHLTRHTPIHPYLDQLQVVKENLVVTWDPVKWLVNITLSTAMNLVHWNSFPKLSNFPSCFTQLCKFPGGGTFEKHADPVKKIETVGNHV